MGPCFQIYKITVLLIEFSAHETKQMNGCLSVVKPVKPTKEQNKTRPQKKLPRSSKSSSFLIKFGRRVPVMLPSNMPSAKNRDSLTHDDDLFPPRDCTYCVFIFHVCCVFTLARGKTLDTRGWCLNWHFIVFCAPCWVLDSGPFVWLSRGNRWKFIAKVCLLLLSVSTRFFFSIFQKGISGFKPQKLISSAFG